MTRCGTLVLVVGPSGAGKDSIMAGARHRLAGDARFRFASRCITRPAGAGGEDHVALTLPEFLRREAEGGFALSWEAHGLRYGIPADIARDLDRGRTVVANVSRTVLAQARVRPGPLCVALVTAPAAVLERRLLDRGRESPAEIRARVRRAGELSCDGGDVVTINNDGALDAAVELFVRVLLGCAQTQFWMNPDGYLPGGRRIVERS